MVKNRLIAVLVIRDGKVVQSIQFKHTNIIHWDPVEAIDSFNGWAVDEIVALNVSRKQESKTEFLKIVDRLADKCFVPLSVGGWIEQVDDASETIRCGADKVIINTAAYEHPTLIEEIAGRHGSQACVVSIDSKPDDQGQRRVCIDRARKLTETAPVEWARTAAERGAGEIFYNSVDHDGNRGGYDLEGIRLLTQQLRIPVIAFGGAQTWEHLEEGVVEAGADAVAAANILHYTEQSVLKAKKYLLSKELNFRGLN
jgi:cyclase